MRKIICHGSRKLALLGIIKLEKAPLEALFAAALRISSFLMKIGEACRYIDIRARIAERSCASLYCSRHNNSSGNREE